MAPKESEIELTFFGYGDGKYIVIHFGSGKCVIINTCLDDAHEELRQFPT